MTLRMDVLETLTLREINQLPPSIVRFTQLRELILANNQLRTLPAELSNLVNLKVLDVSHNELTKWPTAICNSVTLHALSLAHNRLTSIPAGISRLHQLNHIDVSNNRIKSIPPELWKLRQLKVLNLNNNLISSVSSGIQRLRQLSWLGLANNVIQSISSELGNLGMLTFLDLRNNRLREVPKETYDIISLTTLLLDGNPMYSNARHFPVTKTKSFISLKMDMKNTVTYKVGKGCSLSAPPGSVPSEATLTVTTLQDKCLKQSLGDYEMIEYDIIDITPNTYQFLQPVTLRFHCPPSMNSKSLCIKTMDDSKKWKELSTKQTEDAVFANISKCAPFVVISKPRVQHFNVGERGGRIVSEITDDVAFDFPPNAVTGDMDVSMTVHIPDPSLTVAHNSCIEKNIIFGPIVQINERSEEKVYFDKDVKFSLPVPPSDVDQFAPRTVMVFCDAAGDGHWKMITKRAVVDSEKTIQFNRRHFSGYTSVTMPQGVSTSRWLTQKCEKLLQVIKLGIFKVQLILMQMKNNRSMLVLSIVKACECQKKLKSLKELGYDDSGIRRSQMFEMVNGDIITLSVDTRFVIESAGTPTFTEQAENDYEIIVGLTSQRNSRVQGAINGFLECTYEGNEQQLETTMCCWGLNNDSRKKICPPTSMKLSFSLPQNAWVPSRTTEAHTPPLVTDMPHMDPTENNNEMEEEVPHSSQEDSHTINGILIGSQEDHDLTESAGLTASNDLLSKELHSSDWKSFGRTRLGLDDNELDTIVHDYTDSVQEQKYQMLYLWTRKVGKDATVCRLYDYLQEHKLCSIADKLKQFVVDKQTQV